MNTSTVNNAYQLVRQLLRAYFPEEVAGRYLDRGMALKNLSVRLGLSEQLSDETLEEMALSTLFYALDASDNPASACGLGSVVAESALREWRFPVGRTARVLEGMTLLTSDLPAGSTRETVLRKAQQHLKLNRKCPDLSLLPTQLQ